ncbi:MAG: hypothetical protein ACUVTZ_14310 [Armatimonadota bacterium]
MIAKGVAALPEVRSAMAHGTVAIAKGSTNSYVVEEILNQRIDKTAYTTGITLPSRPAVPPKLADQKLPDVIFRQGQRLNGVTVPEIVGEMKRGDVLIKGANALNYKERVAGILIGHPTGGTIGSTYGTVVSRGITLVIPVGFEKCIPENIAELSVRLRQCGEVVSDGMPGLFPVTGLIVTEIEAVETLVRGVRATVVAAGGICGAEGAVWLYVEGERDAVRRAADLIATIQGEPPFGA